MTDKSKNRHGNLKIDAPLDDALRAALEIKPQEKKPSKKKKRRPKSPCSIQLLLITAIA